MNKSWIAAVVVLCVAGMAAAQPAGKKIKVGVAADSLATNGERPWPTVLAEKLGPGYEVNVQAANGLSVLHNTYRDLWVRYELSKALAYQPDIALIGFGASDAKPGNWARKKEFVANYKTIIAKFKALPSKPKIYITLPPPATKDAPYGIDRKILHEELIPTLKQIAQDTGVEVIDTHTPLLGRTDVTVSDGLYPTTVGFEIMALTVYKALTGKDAALPAAPKEPTKEEKAAQDVALAVKAPHVKMMNVGDVAELMAADVANPKGDGPDGKGNTDDDTWQFWLEISHSKGTWHRLVSQTSLLTPEERANGIRDAKARRGAGKVRGPIAGALPNPNDTEGWIFVMDWDGRFEGVWGDKKANQVMMHGYVEKNVACGVAFSFRIPADGAYDIAAKITDMQPVAGAKGDGVSWRIEAIRERTGNDSPKPDRVVAKGGPVGDKVGPLSADIAVSAAEFKKGELVRFVVDPNEWWGTDLTKIDFFRIKRVK